VNNIKETIKPFDSEAVCGVFVNEKGQVLLARRSFGDNTHDLMGGNILPNETPIETLIRDAKGKLGVNLNKEDVEGKGISNIVYPNRTVKTHIFVCQLRSNTPIQLDLDKYSGWRWFYPIQIKKLLLHPKVGEVLVTIGLLN
jgi:hypothetical protein